MTEEKQKSDNESGEEDENEVALAVVAECQVGDKTYKAGESWHGEGDDCRLHICNPGGIVSHLSCPQFDVDEKNDSYVTIPGNDKYIYPQCCDYVFRVKKEKEKGTKKKDKTTKEAETTKT